MFKNELRHDQPSPPNTLTQSVYSTGRTSRTVRAKNKNDGEMKSRNEVIRDSLWHYINQCNTSCWAVTQMTQMG